MKPMRLICVLAGTFACVLASTHAQQPALPPGIVIQSPVRPGEENTIRKALEDMRSEEAAIRVGAAMLLGKYPNPLAQQGLIQALNDPDVRVRRAAVVSLTDRTFLQIGYDPYPVLRLLNDPDVEIRRNVSYNLSTLLSYVPRIRFNQGITGLGIIEGLPDDIVDAVMGAFMDEDAIVRRNMIESFERLRQPIPERFLLRLINDPDSTVRILILPIAASRLSTELFVNAASRAVESGSPEWLQLYARLLSDHDTSLALPQLRELAKSDYREVRNEAYISALLIEPRDPRPLEIYQDLLQERLDPGQGMRFIRSISVLPSSLAEPSLRPLLTLENPQNRSYAVKSWLRALVGSPSEEVLFRLLQDDYSGVRTEVMDYLRRHTAQVSPRLMEELLFSEFVDVRRDLISLSLRLPQREQHEILMELILDQDEGVRVRAIVQFIQRQLPDWKDVALKSLRDPSYTIQRSTIDAILRQFSPDLRPFLEDVRAQLSEPSLINRIDRVLNANTPR